MKSHNREGRRDLPKGVFPRGFSRDHPFPWPLVPAKDLVRLNYGKSLVGNSRLPGRVPVYGTNGQCGWHNVPLFQGPGVILGRKGMGPLGVEWCEQDYWVIDTAYAAQAEVADLDLKFFYYLVKYIGLNHLKDGTSNPSLTRQTFGEQLLPKPPLSEQKAMARILSSFDDKIELNRRTNETLEAMARAIFKSWFVDFDPVQANAEGRRIQGLDTAIQKLFPDRFQDSPLGPIPRGWSVSKFADTVEVLGGGTPKTGVADYWNGDIPWFSVVDAPSETDVYVVDTEKHISPIGLENSSAQILPPGTTIISARGTVGKLALVAVPVAMNQSCYGLRGNGDQGAFYTYFSAKAAVAYLQQIGHGSVFNTITRDSLRVAEVVTPAATVFAAFEDVVAPHMKRILANLNESTTLGVLRDALLPKLLSGEIRLGDLA